MNSIKNEVGKTYMTRSIGNHDCCIFQTIVKRTEKTVTTADGKTFRLSVRAGVEQFLPWGRFSMAPVMGADEQIEVAA